MGTVHGVARAGHNLETKLSPPSFSGRNWKVTGQMVWIHEVQFSSVQSLSRVQLFATPWTAACQASLSITSSWSLLKLMSIELVIPSNPLILCYPLLLLPSIFSSIRVFSKELVLCIRWPKYWNYSFSISPSNEYSGLISFRIDWFDFLAVSCDQQCPFFKRKNSMLENGIILQDHGTIFGQRDTVMPVGSQPS